MNIDIQENNQQNSLENSENTSTNVNISTKKYNCKSKKSIRTKIGKLSKEGKMEIFKIVKCRGERYSANKNGILFDLSGFKDETLDEISNFIEYNEVNSENLQKTENLQNDFRSQLNNLN